MEVRWIKKRIWAIVCIFLIFFGVSCTFHASGPEKPADGADSPREERDFFAMDTYMKAIAYGPAAKDALTQAEAEVRRLEALLSTEAEGNDIAGLNQNGQGNVAPETSFLIQYSLELHAQTDGMFNIAIYPLMEAWGFPSRNYQIPEEETLQRLLALADISQITIEEASGSIRFGVDGMKIDLGGIAKGYASSRIMEIWKDCGIESGMVSLGGNVQALGTKPDGSLWRIAIQSPSKDGYLGILEIQDKAVITSGGYERYFEQDGITYHHIINPANGYPADSGLASVTIISENGTLADGLSTALFLMGQEKAFEFWRQHKEEFDFILLSDDGRLYVTEGAAPNFTSDFEFQIITKEQQ